MPEAASELVAGYAEGVTIKELETQFQISRTTVIAHLRRAGTATRYNVLEACLDEAKRFYDQGWSLAKVGAHFDVSPSTVATNSSAPVSLLEQ